MIKRGIIAFILQIFFCFQVLAEENITEFEFSQAELDQILAPVALYPDTILSHILIASTYPLEVVQAHRWAEKNPDISSEEAVKAVANRDWDPSVKALAPFPNILKQMSEDLDWMQKLGDAFLQNEELVLASIQDLRQRAYEEGNLDEMEHLTVKHEDEHIIIEPSSPEIVYVPYYDSRIVYGSWWWVDYPPVVWVHHHHHYSHHGPWLYWGPRVYVGTGFYFSSFHWHNRHVVVINHNHYRRHRYPGHYVSHHRDARRWEHNTRHRRGVEYRHPRISERHNINVRHPRDSRDSREVATRLRENNQSRQYREDNRANVRALRENRDSERVNISRNEQNNRSSRQAAVRDSREQAQNVQRSTPPKKVFRHSPENRRYTRDESASSENESRQQSASRTNRYDRNNVFRSSERSSSSSSRESQSNSRYSNSNSSSNKRYSNSRSTTTKRSSSSVRNSRHQR